MRLTINGWFAVSRSPRGSRVAPLILSFKVNVRTSIKSHLKRKQFGGTCRWESLIPTVGCSADFLISTYYCNWIWHIKAATAARSWHVNNAAECIVQREKKTVQSGQMSWGMWERGQRRPESRSATSPSREAAFASATSSLRLILHRDTDGWREQRGARAESTARHAEAVLNYCVLCPFPSLSFSLRHQGWISYRRNLRGCNGNWDAAERSPSPSSCSLAAVRSSVNGPRFKL